MVEVVVGVDHLDLLDLLTMAVVEVELVLAFHSFQSCPNLILVDLVEMVVERNLSLFLDSILVENSILVESLILVDKHKVEDLHTMHLELQVLDFQNLTSVASKTFLVESSMLKRTSLVVLLVPRKLFCLQLSI